MDWFLPTFTAKQIILPCFKLLRNSTRKPLSSLDSYVSNHLEDITAPVTSFKTSTLSPLNNISDLSTR